jgi:cysteine-rich repeat protein
VCGDGSVGIGEACDDGNTSNEDYCTTQCTKNICGDAIVNNQVDPDTGLPQEACDL